MGIALCLTQCCDLKWLTGLPGTLKCWAVPLPEDPCPQEQLLAALAGSCQAVGAALGIMAEFLPVILLVWFFTFPVTRKSRGRSELFKGYFLYLCSGMSEGDPPQC